MCSYHTLVYRNAVTPECNRRRRRLAALPLVRSGRGVLDRRGSRGTAIGGFVAAVRSGPGTLARAGRNRAGAGLVALLLAASIPVAGVAQTPELNPARPDVYTVKKGDTLWDISARFLRKPWLWPQIWKANPQIENPDLIYPGDEVALVFTGGKPALRVRRGGRPTVKLGPRVRVEKRQFRAIPTIPIEAISQFLSRPRIVAAGDLDRAPYIVSVGKEHLVAGSGYRVFARGFGDSGAKRYTVFRKGRVYVDPDSDDREVLGFEAVHIADAVVESTGDPTTLRLTASRREVLIGDRMLPVDDTASDQNFLPRAPDGPVKGRIIQVVEGVTQIGQYQVVVLNLGTSRGIEPGHVMAVYQAGATVNDDLAPQKERLAPPQKGLPPGQTAVGPKDVFDAVLRFGTEVKTVLIPEMISPFLPKKTKVPQPKTWPESLGEQFLPDWKSSEVVTLPDERAGTIMVFRAFDRISYALVMKAARPMHVLDTVTNP